jgi:hypothetical protein
MVGNAAVSGDACHGNNTDDNNNVAGFVNFVSSSSSSKFP